MSGNSSSDCPATDPLRLHLLREQADSLPTDGLEQESRRDALVRNLAAFAAGVRTLPPEIAALTLRLLRRDLLDLYSGFALNTSVFAPASVSPSASPVIRFRPRRLPPLAQTRVQARLRSLLSIPLAGEEGFRWVVAALRGELPALLRQSVQQSPPLRRLLTRSGLTVAQTLSLSTNDRTPEYEFGLTLLYLLVEAGGQAPDEAPFETLLAVLDGWVADFPYFPEGRVRDFVPVLTRFAVTESRRAALRERLLAWCDLERYPAQRSFPVRRDYVRAQAHAWGWRGLPLVLADLAARLIEPGPVLPQNDDISREREQILRLSTLLTALGALALQDESALAPALDLFTALLHRFLLAIQGVGGLVEVEWALLDLLPALLAHPAWLEPLADRLEAVRFYQLSEGMLDDLSERRLTLDLPALRALLDLRRARPRHLWIQQVWAHCAGLHPAAMFWLLAELRARPDPILLEAALSLAALLTPRGLASELNHTIAAGLLRLLSRLEAPFDPAWVSGLLRNQEALRQVFLRLAEFPEITAPGPSLRAFLRSPLEAVNDLRMLTPELLTALCLVTPEDELRSGLPLSERLRLAAEFLRGRRPASEALTWLERLLPGEVSPEQRERLTSRDPLAWKAVRQSPRLASILLEGWKVGELRVGASRRRAIARALACAPSPLALPLLRDLFDLACAMIRAWHATEYALSEFYHEANLLAQEIARSLFALSPLLPEAVSLMRDLLLTHETLPEHGFDLNAQFVREQLLPKLVHQSVHESAIPSLLDLAQHPPPEAPPYRQELFRQVALQALSNVRTLRLEQQQALWETAYASPAILSRALTLLVLGRQHPPGERTRQEVLRLLRASPQTLFAERRRELARLAAPEAYGYGPGDVFLLGGVAVALAAEWLQDAGALSPTHRTGLWAALRQAAGDFRRAAEARLAESTHPHLPAEASAARSLALSLCDALGRSPEEDPDWLTRPADLAAWFVAAFPPS